MNRLFLLGAGCIMAAFLACKAQNRSSSPVEETVQTPAPAEVKPEAKATPLAITGLQGPATHKVRIKTKFGDMVAVLYDETPLHRDNFLKLVKENFYDSLLFHRCIAGFMAQGGDPDSKHPVAGKPLGAGGPGYTTPAEITTHLLHKKGALSAARQGDQVNPEKKSSGSQFYVVQGRVQSDATLAQISGYKKAAHPDKVYTPEQINMYKTIGGTPDLDWDYTVFGEVIEGLDVLDKILAQPTNKSGMMRDRPLEDIIMDIDIIQ